MSVFYDTASNFHPYECNGPGKCVHCDRQASENHDPKTCALCAAEPIRVRGRGGEYEEA